MGPLSGWGARLHLDPQENIGPISVDDDSCVMSERHGNKWPWVPDFTIRTAHGS